MYPTSQQLRDIHGLDGIPWWPLAPGWWLVLIGSLLLLLAMWRYRSYLRLRLPVPVIGNWRWDAARRLRDLRRRVPRQDGKASAGELSELLRRIAMARHGRRSCAGLTGPDWLTWLAEHDPTGFDWRDQGRLLLNVPYARPGVTDSAEGLLRLIDAAHTWVAEEGKKRV